MPKQINKLFQQVSNKLKFTPHLLSIIGVRLLDVMLDRDVDLLPYIGWDGDVSNLTSIKQKLIDARISLESASIQTKKESINDIEKLCEKISYLAGGDQKFDMMMTIIRTCRYSLNEHDKADQIERKMRKGMFIHRRQIFNLKNK
jgi:hypothetical protein